MKRVVIDARNDVGDRGCWEQVPKWNQKRFVDLPVAALARNLRQTPETNFGNRGTHTKTLKLLPRSRELEEVQTSTHIDNRFVKQRCPVREIEPKYRFR